MSRRTLRVIINPFSAPLDENGRPCAIVHYDPEHTGKPGSVRRIGCALDRSVEKAAVEHPMGRRWSTPVQYQRYNTKVLYNLEPQPIVDSLYHRRLVQDGSLIPANDETTRLCGVGAKNASDVLCAAAAERLQDWIYEHDGERPNVEAWIADGQFKSWPGEGGADALTAALERASARAADATKKGQERVKAAAAPQNAPREPLSDERESVTVQAVLEPGENMTLMEQNGGDS